MQRFTVLLILIIGLVIVDSNPIQADIPQPPAQDSDGDGIPDSEDPCPNIFAELGCPPGNPGAGTEEPAPPEDNGSGEADADGIPDSADNCPFVSGLGTRFGGRSGSDGCPVDSDGDGVNDGNDRCPFDPTTTSPPCNTGQQQTEPEPEPATNTPAPLPSLPSSGQCVLATSGRFDVNVRAEPVDGAEIVDIIVSQQVYPVERVSEEGDWYQLADFDGWVAASVTRTGGDCPPNEQLTSPETTKTDGLNCPEVGDVEALPIYVQNALADNDTPCEDATNLLQEIAFGEPGIRHLPNNTSNQMEENCPALLEANNFRLARLQQYDQDLYERTIERISGTANPCEEIQGIPNAPEIGAVWCMPHFDDTDIVHLSERTQGYINDFGGEVSSCLDIYQVHGMGDLTSNQRNFIEEIVPACDIQSYTQALELVSLAMSVNADFGDVLGDNRICVGLDPAQVILEHEQPAPPASAPSLPPEFVGCPTLGQQIRNHNDDLTPIALLSILKARHPCDAGREYIATGRIPTLPVNVGRSLENCLAEQLRNPIAYIFPSGSEDTGFNTVQHVPLPDQSTLSMGDLADGSPTHWLANASTPWAVKLAMMPTGDDDPCDTSYLPPELPETVCAHFITKQYQNLSGQDPISVEARLMYYGLDNSGNRQIVGTASQWTSMVLPPTGSGGVAFGTRTLDRRPQYDFIVQTRVLTLSGQSVNAGNFTTQGNHQVIVGRSAQCADNQPEQDTNLGETGQICVRYRGHFVNNGEMSAPARVTLGYEGQPRTIHIHETPTQEVYIPGDGYGATMTFTTQIAQRPNRSVQAFYHMYPGDNVQNVSERIQTVAMSNCEDDFTPIPDEGAPAATPGTEEPTPPTETATSEVAPASATQQPTPTPQPERVLSGQLGQEFCIVVEDVRFESFIEGDTYITTKLHYRGSDIHKEHVGHNYEGGAATGAFLRLDVPGFTQTVFGKNKGWTSDHLSYRYDLISYNKGLLSPQTTYDREGKVQDEPLLEGGEITLYNRHDEDAPTDCQWERPEPDDSSSQDRNQGILDCGPREPRGLMDERRDVHEYSIKGEIGDQLDITLNLLDAPIRLSAARLSLLDPDDETLFVTETNDFQPDNSTTLNATLDVAGWHTIQIEKTTPFQSYQDPGGVPARNYELDFNCTTGAVSQSGSLPNVGGLNGLPQLDFDFDGIERQLPQAPLPGSILVRHCVAFTSQVNNTSQSNTTVEVQLVAEDSNGNTRLVSQTYSQTIPAGETRPLNFEQEITLFSSEQIKTNLNGGGVSFTTQNLTFQGAGSDCSDNQIPGQLPPPPTTTVTPIPTAQPVQQTQAGQSAGGQSPVTQTNLSNDETPVRGQSSVSDDTVPSARRADGGDGLFAGTLAAVGIDENGVLYGISEGQAIPFFNQQPHERIAAPAISPNGSRLAYIGINNETRRLYVLNVERDIEAVVSIGDLTVTDDQPVWSADSTELLVTLTTQDGQRNIYKLKVDQTLEIDEPLIGNASQPTLSPNGDYLLFAQDGEIFSQAVNSRQIVQVTDNDMRCVTPVIDSNNLTAYLVCDETLYRYNISELASLGIPQITGIRAGSETGRIATYDNAQDGIQLYDTRDEQRYTLDLDVVLTRIDWR